MPVHIALSGAGTRFGQEGLVRATRLETDGAAGAEKVPGSALAEFVGEREREGVRWVWDSTARWYPDLLAAGVRVARCHDLRLIRRILALSSLVPDGAQAHRAEWDDWDGGWGGHGHTAGEETLQEEALFAVEPVVLAPPEPERDVLAEWRRQQSVLTALGASSPRDAHRLRLLVAAENSGALAAAELAFDGLPFRADLHDATLTRLLGPRPVPGTRPQRLEALAAQIRETLQAPGLNPDSPPHLLRELRRHGLDVTSTNRWEIATQDHPVVEPLIEYKKLARLASANGWSWMDTWAGDGRFRSEYVPAGVVTGRWSSRGGGALSLPKVIRGAVRADEGWRLVVADAAQLEPRILAAMSRDEAMLRAGASGDLYQGLVESGVVDTRDHAKVGMLAVLYGSTTGTSATLLPRLARAYPRAMALVEEAARAGEAGGVVTTWLGRSSPPPTRAWHEDQASAADPEAGSSAESRARSRAREWGRFTRNFVVQGTAAEWALAWSAGVRLGLRDLDDDGDAHLAFFLHDELVVHAPAALVGEVSRLLVRAADDASHLLFPHLSPPAGEGEGLVPLDVVVVSAYDEVDAPDPPG